MIGPSNRREFCRPRLASSSDPAGRELTAARSNGVDTSYSYDDAGRLTGVGHTGPNGGIDGFSYMLDPNGNRTAAMSNAGTETYTLDVLNRLTNVTYPGALSETFVYDAAGNRTSHTKTDGTTVGFTVDATGQLISDTSGTTYTYDAAGNLTSTSDGESYTYDDYGRHISISAGGVTQTYGYDAANVRVTVDAQTQLWDRNGGLPTLISTGAGDNYVHTAGIARDGDGWLLADAVGSVRTIVDNTGAATGSQSFTAFGEQLTGSGTFGFAGEQQDPTGLQHLRARQYNPTLGRFTTVDPIQPGAPGTTGYNLYAYAGNNPTTWIDPSGQNVPYTATLQPSQQATPGLVGIGAAVALSFYLSMLRESTIDVDLGEIADLLQDIGETITPEIPPVEGPRDALREIARRVLPVVGSGCVGPAAAEALLLPGRAWSARPAGFDGAERTNGAAAVWCVLPLEWNRDLALSSGGPEINEGHSETQIIRDFRFKGGELRSPWTTFGLFAIHSNMSPCNDCQFNVDNLRREFLGLTVICSYSYSFDHEKQEYRDSHGQPLRRIPRPC